MCRSVHGNDSRQRPSRCEHKAAPETILNPCLVWAWRKEACNGCTRAPWRVQQKQCSQCGTPMLCGAKRGEGKVNLVVGCFPPLKAGNWGRSQEDSGGVFWYPVQHDGFSATLTGKENNNPGTPPPKKQPLGREPLSSAWNHPTIIPQPMHLFNAKKRSEYLSMIAACYLENRKQSEL